ncbi:hypothetical protein L798_04936 [Zootermopsis nevadensis]|uniref:Uncharacterized protein n=1 Tax=Zootermopsis nevadensis TaxID=136037 RepID=A0A067R9N5_ZOONE|nr:hypothetical protein L798_04936 [Zootermopsis nevadensis]
MLLSISSSVFQAATFQLVSLLKCYTHSLSFKIHRFPFDKNDATYINHHLLSSPHIKITARCATSSCSFLPSTAEVDAAVFHTQHIQTCSQQSQHQQSVTLNNSEVKPSLPLNMKTATVKHQTMNPFPQFLCVNSAIPSTSCWKTAMNVISRAPTAFKWPIEVATPLSQSDSAL